MSAKNLHDKSVEQLNEELMSLLKAQFGLRMQAATNQLQKTSEIKKTRREIARIKTILSQKVGQ
ncbi:MULTISPECIES: 50S ribosomal protein L29 [Vitreoscilla]|jgi:large subunit ribosomal protein L29|uniref:Large ribosomal subunit protein uL29 n=1 Tax=Vitreoscilla stercoraria TaxID=61 RepID=A0ABY4E923_VITST|nr:MULTISPECIES: 50S ribosomal protein L29 [Vitreoscilla]AUZ06474.1 50S ribosomal protein L29 [Vitreoscilla sp. C1]UOO92242.1 50S ribosomal protein L29 [Vitreoscilla stercoraria]